MAHKCRIPRKDGGSAPSRADLQTFALKDILPKLVKIYNNKEYYNSGIISPTKIKKAVISVFKSMGDKYYPSEYKYIEQAVDTLWDNPKMAFLKSILPNGAITSLLTLKGSAEKVSSKVFTDTILDDTASEHDAIDFFLRNAYGSAVSAKMQLERKMNNVVLNTFVINREKGIIISNMTEALREVTHYKRELLKDIQNFFKDQGIKSGLTSVDIDTADPNSIAFKYRKDISRLLQVGMISESELQDLYEDSNNPYSDTQRSSKLKLDAYGSWLAIQHFDNFVKMTLGDTIIINPSSDTRYSYSSKGTNMNTTWRKDDNIDLQAEVNKLTQALINTSPMFRFGSLMPMSGSYMQFSDFSYITAKVKDLVYNPISSSIFVDKLGYVMDILTEDEKTMVKNKSFRHIISNSRYNPQKYLPLIYKILTAGSDQTGYFINQFTNFNTQDKNILWTMYKNLYDSKLNALEGGIHSLYSIQKTNPGSKNYFAAVSSVADCIFSVDFTQYVYEDGIIQLRTLRDAAVDKTRKEIEGIVNNKNSQQLVKNFDFSPYHIVERDVKGGVSEDSELDGISFRINLSDNSEAPDYLYVHIQKMGESIKLSKSESPTGRELTHSELVKLDENKAVLRFFDEVLGLNFTGDSDLKTAYKELTAQRNDVVGPYLRQMLEYSSHVFFNRYFAKTYLADLRTKSEKKAVIKKYFKDEETRPKFNGSFFNMEMTPSKKYNTLLTLAQALGTTRGVNSSRQVKDSDNAALSSQTLSRLLGNLVQQIDMQIGVYNTLRTMEADLAKLQAEFDGSLNPAFRANKLRDIEAKKEEIENFKRESYILDSTQQPAASHFDLITKPGLFRGIVKSEEIKGLLGNKKQVKFTTAEAVISSFVHNFVLGHCAKGDIRGKSDLHDGVVGLLPSVNSDKTTVSFAEFDLNTEALSYSVKEDFKKLTTWAIQNKKINVPINPDTQFKELHAWVKENNSDASNEKTTPYKKLLELVSEYNKANPTNPIILIDQIHYKVKSNIGNLEYRTRTYLSLDNSELVKVIMYEIGKYYQTMYNNVKSDFDKLSTVSEVPINPDNNFAELNAYIYDLRAAGSNISASDYIFDLVQKYNEDNPKTPIRLIDQIHYIDSKNGTIKFNLTIRSLKDRFSSATATKDFFDLKSTEVLKSALDAGLSINLYGNTKLDGQPEVKYLREKYPKWINKSGQMILATVNIDGVTYNIATNNDMRNLEKVLTIRDMVASGVAADVKVATAMFNENPDRFKREFGWDRLTTKIHKLTGKVQLHPMLEKYNLMDYLFTQQFMYSTVGSHVAHPSKAKYDTPIIWAHPAIGKSYVIENGTYANKFMDWDVEFNHRRDSWIAKHSGTVEGTPEFRQARSYYQMNWESIPEYEAFVKREWDRITLKAHDENKILVASPHMLLKMFPDKFDSVLTMSYDAFTARSKERGDSDPHGWKTDLDATLTTLKANPVFASKVKEIEDDEYLTTLIERGKLQKELDLIRDNEMAEEASRFYAQHKRNVSFTAAMSQFQLNQIEGIPTWYNISVIKDIKQALFTVDGNTNSAKPYDGATFVNPFIVYLENYSLNEARAGIDKKQFVHFYDELTGSGGIIKTAGFGVTNDRMRNSLFYRDLMRNMTYRKWKDHNGDPYIADITKDYMGNDVDYGTFYFKRGNKYYEARIESEVIPKVDATGKPLMDSFGNVIPEKVIYKRYLTEIKQDGEVVKEIAQPEIFDNIDNNYALWELFGGMNSCEFNGSYLQFSETSIIKVVEAMNKHGYKKPGWTPDDITAEHIEQPLKNADIHYMPTEGAVKQGIANINPNTYYRGEQNLNSYRIRMTNAGIQLDKEHHADGSKLSLMTQVISSACSMGYNPREAKRLYSALYHLTLQGVKPYINSFRKLLHPSADPEMTQKDMDAFGVTIAECMAKNMVTSTAQDGDMLRAIATDLIDKVRSGQTVTAEDAKTIPYSDPSIFNKLVSTLSTMMTKSGIKAKMDGILSVLCPTQGIVKMFDFVDENGVRHTLTLSQLEDMYSHLWEDGMSQYDFTNKVLDYVQSQQKPMYNSPDFDHTQITVGKKYKIKFKNTLNDLGEIVSGKEVIVDVTYPHNTGALKGSDGEIVGYQAVKNLLTSGHAVYGEVESIQEWVRDGNELKSINFRFRGSDGKMYQFWDIDYIQDLFSVVTASNKKDVSIQDKINLYKGLITKYEGSLSKYADARARNFALYANGGNLSEDAALEHELHLLKLYTRQIQQNILFAVSKNNPNKIPPMKIGGKDILIDKDSIEVDAYELVMPKVFLEEFGLENYSSLDEIIHDKDFFYKRMVNNFTTNVHDEKHYDVELKRTNGKHIYLKDRSGLQEDWESDLEEVIIHKHVDDSGQVWRMDLVTGQKMYQLFSEHDKVYRVPGTDTEIILTSTQKVKDDDGKEYHKSGITHYLDTFKYQSIHISDAIADGSNEKPLSNDRPKFEDILYRISKSSNKNAQTWLDLFRDKENPKLWIKDKIALNQELNDFKGLKPSLQRHLREQATAMHTSLMKSLDVIAARIPAQNQQSFMPMKVVAWDNPNINTAYVSVMQFFLQGSDLDIDAVSLLTFSFSPSGEFYSWSPDFDMSDVEMLNISMRLPFPTGSNLETVIYETEETHTKVSDRKPLITENEHYKALLEEFNRKQSLPEGYEEALQNNPDLAAGERAYTKAALKHYIALLDDINEAGGVIYFDTVEAAITDFAKDLVKRINKHNNYINKAGDKITEGAIKNYVVSSLHSIASDAANWLEAHTGVDVATGPLKFIASQSELSEVQKTFTPGNVINKFQAIEEASVGKDDIAICATGLKGFFAATQFCNDYLNNNLQDPNLDPVAIQEISKIITFNPVTIGGKLFTSLANIRVDDLEKVNPDSPIYHILKNKGFDEDASVIMSALLSLSTDNAKDLALAKVNAGTNMMGLYLYGAAIGMNFKVLNQIIASPLGFTVAKLLNSNEFTATRSKGTIDSALSYLTNGPSWGDLKRFNGVFSIGEAKFRSIDMIKHAIKTVLESDGDLHQTIARVIGSEDDSVKIDEYNLGSVIAKLVADSGTQVASEFISKIRDAFNAKIEKWGGATRKRSDFKAFQALGNQMLDFLNEFSEQTATLHNNDYVSEYGPSNITDDFNKLALGADEFKRLGQMLRLNQEIKTKPDELITFVQRLETITTDRIKVIKNTAKRIGYEKLGITDQEALKNIQKFDFKMFAESFIDGDESEDSYYKAQIENYERACKSCINPLRILTSVDHYKGYFTSMILAYEGDYTKSVKFRAIKHLGNSFIDLAKVSKGTDQTNVYKGVQNFVDDYINNAYLRSLNPIQLPKSSEGVEVKIVDEYGTEHANEFENTHIQLGTDSGNTTFETFFENVFVPELKKAFGSNEFVKSLTSVLINDPITGSKHVAISLPINMMPSSENERILLNKHKNAFNKIANLTLTINGVSFPIMSMFHYYSLLKFRGKGGRSSLMRIFEDKIAKEPIFVRYRTFINEFDSKYDFAIDDDNYSDIGSNKEVIPIDISVLAQYLAPLANPKIATAQVIRFKDTETNETVLLKKKPKEKKAKDGVNPEGSEDYENDGGSDENTETYSSEDDYGDAYNQDDIAEAMGGVEMGDAEIENKKYVYTPDYGEYELFKGVGVLTRFSPPSLKPETKYNQIIDSYHVDGNTFKNITIVRGKVVQYTYNGKIKDVEESKLSVMKIVKLGDKTTFQLDEATLTSILKHSLC